MRKRIAWALLAAALGLYLFRHPVALAVLDHRRAPRPDVFAEPLQTAAEREPFEFLAGGGRYRLTPRFRYDQPARVVSERRYRFGAAAALIPVDLALAWGPVLRPPYAERISFSQFSRFYFWRTKESALDRGTIVSHTANVHVIPATARLRWATAALGRGDDVLLQGWLVDVTGVDRPDFRWGTSVARDDEGPGGCETIFLTRLTVGERVYE